MLSRMLEKSFAVRLWEKVFEVLRDYHPLGLVFAFLKKKLKAEGEREYALIDVWVHFHLLLAIVLWAAFGIADLCAWVIGFFVVYGILRISYIVVYMINVIFFDQFRLRSSPKIYMVRSYRRVLIYLFVNYAELLLWFAIFYRFRKHWFCWSDVCLNTMWGSLYFSIVTMTTLGYGDIEPLNNRGAFLCGLQALLGVFWAVVAVARFITVLPRYESLDPEEAEQE